MFYTVDFLAIYGHGDVCLSVDRTVGRYVWYTENVLIIVFYIYLYIIFINFHVPCLAAQMGPSTRIFRFHRRSVDTFDWISSSPLSRYGSITQYHVHIKPGSRYKYRVNKYGMSNIWTPSLVCLDQLKRVSPWINLWEVMDLHSKSAWKPGLWDIDTLQMILRTMENDWHQN